MPLIMLILMTLLCSLKVHAAPETHTHTQPSSQHHYLKPGAPVRMQGPENTDIKLGEVKTLNFKFISTADSGSALITLNANPRLQIAAGSSYTYDLSQGAISLDVEINPNQEGRFYIQFFIEINNKTRAFSYPVNVGDVADIEASAIQEKTSSDNIKIMQAQERVRLQD